MEDDDDDFAFEDDDDDGDNKGVGLSLRGVVDPVSQLNLSTDLSFSSTPPSPAPFVFPPGVTKLNRQQPMFPTTPSNNGNGMNGFHGGEKGGKVDFEDICRRTKENIEERVKILQEAVKANDLGIYNEKMNGLAANYTDSTQLALQETRRRLEYMKSIVRDREEKSRVLEGQVSLLRREVLKQTSVKLQDLKATQRKLSPLQTLFLCSILFLLFLRILDHYDHSSNTYST